MSKKIQYLVVDTSAFIKAANLQDLAEHVYSVQEVVDEITNDRQRKKLVALPYDLKIKDVFTESVKFITEFSKKTGDYTSLSATDIKVMALTYQLEKEYVGVEHLKSEPKLQKTIKVSGISNFEVHPKDETINKSNASDTAESISKSNNYDLTSVNNHKHVAACKDQDMDVEEDEEIANQIKNLELGEENDANEIIAKILCSDEENESDSDTETDSDGGEWITPSNLADKKKEQDIGEFENKSVVVACITSDFAMQNVLKHLGLNVATVDGRVIKQLRTFIFRCTTCFKTTSIMTKLFCPKCGHATLKKVGVSIDDDGNQHIHINGRKPLNAKGKRFSLPTPRGGQHFQYPILTEDQHIHKRFASKTARGKTNALDPDYIAGFSPFAVKDVTSKSAVLGVRADKQDIKYWMKHYSKGKKK